jgi:hypothetical protein
MRRMLAIVLVPFALAAFVASSFAALDGTGPGPGLTGNDTGGIIQWTPDVAHIYRAVAAEHCARWHRIARITSVRRRYGDYVGFRCIVDRRYDPRKDWLYPAP